MNCEILKADSEGMARASQLIRQGDVLAFPTETFYGLGADALNEQALKKIYRIKEREEKKPLLILVADQTWVSGLVKEIPPVAQGLMDRFWPGPLTLVCQASPLLPVLLTGGTGKVGLRISSHPVARTLVQEIGKPITATSANRSGQAGITSPAEVFRSLGGQIEAILDGGETAGGLGSTVLDVTSTPPQILREGAVLQGELTSLLGRI